MDFSKYVKEDSLVIRQKQIDIKELVSFLQSRPYITKLSLVSCEVSDEDARELAKLTNLTSLSLRNNYISNEGARELARLTNLTSFNLSSNYISNEGARELAKLTNLTSLNLRNNNVSYNGTAELLAKLTKLKELDLSSNDISYNDAKKLDKHISSVELLLSRDRNGNINLGCDNFIDKTLNKREYREWLSDSDIDGLAKHYYKWNGNNGVIFVDHNRPLWKQLDMWKNNRDRALISIVFDSNLEHWVLLVAHKNHVFFVDSLKRPISKCREAEKQYNYLRGELQDITIHELLLPQQQHCDMHNCGVYALENARIILENIDKDVSVIKEKLEEAYPCDDNRENYYERLNGKRKEFALALKEFSTGKKVQSSIKNEKLSEVSTKNGKHGNYAAASFVLAVAFAVGASLTISNPAVFITLVVATFAALAIGCYCSYKANTALNDVEADQIKKGEEVILRY